MRYRLGDIELTRPLPALELTVNEVGIALLVRQNGQPIGFLMRETNGKTKYTSSELSSWLYGELRTKIVEEAIRRELGTARQNGPFPTLSVCICTRNRGASLDRCLTSVLPLQRKHDFELLVIDNAPSDDVALKVARKFDRVRYILEPHPGLDFARNRAWMEASGDLVAYLDDDVVVDTGWLDGLREAWNENPDAAAFTGLVMPLSLDTSAQVLFEEGGGFRRGFDKKKFGRVSPGNSFYPCGAGIFGTGCNMAFNRDVLREIGGFDEALDTGAPLPGGGDLDMFYRIIRAGHTLIYEPAYMVFHEHRSSESALRHQYYTWGLGFMAFVEKSYRNDPSQRGRFLRLLVWWFRDQISNLVATLRRGNFQSVWTVSAELLGGFVGIFGEYSRSLKRVATIGKKIG